MVMALWRTVALLALAALSNAADVSAQICLVTKLYKKNKAVNRNLTFFAHISNSYPAAHRRGPCTVGLRQHVQQGYGRSINHFR